MLCIKIWQMHFIFVCFLFPYLFFSVNGEDISNTISDERNSQNNQQPITDILQEQREQTEFETNSLQPLTSVVEQISEIVNESPPEVEIDQINNHVTNESISSSSILLLEQQELIDLRERLEKVNIYLMNI